MNLRRVGATMVLCATVLAACGDDPGGQLSPTSTSEPVTTSTTASGPATQDCTSRRQGFRVEFPAGWHTNDPIEAPRCTYFHPEPFVVPQATDDFGIAIGLKVEDRPYDEAVPPPGSSVTDNELSREETLLSGRRALRREVEATGEGLFPPGHRSVTWYLELGERTLVAATGDGPEPGSLSSNTEVLARMVGSVQALPGDEVATCSAADLDPAPEPQPQLPEPVAAQRADIVEAAVACDYEALAALALAGDEQFTFTFGGGDDPAEHWRSAEERGEEVLRFLVGLLDAPFGVVEPQELDREYVWPRAFAYGTWDDVPEEDRSVLEPFYIGRFGDFELFGGYLGYRIGITETGDWLYFVAGD